MKIAIPFRQGQTSDTEENLKVTYFITKNYICSKEYESCISRTPLENSGGSGPLTPFVPSRTFARKFLISGGFAFVARGLLAMH